MADERWLFVEILFWYSGSKRQGKRRLEICANYGQIAPLAAKMVLIDVYIQEKEYDKSKKLRDSLFVEYPKSRFFQWSNCRYCRNTG